MKTTCLTLLLQLSSAAILPHAKPLTDPHFPSHQLSKSSQDLLSDNTPITPAKDIHPSHALAALMPLESSYLQSLANPAIHPPTRDPVAKSAALPAKPTSALPILRKEDDIRYWATVELEKHTTEVQDEAREKEAATFSSGILRTMRICPEHRGFTSRLSGNPLMMAREYSDVLVVGIVLLFLILVVVLETKEKCGGVRFRRNRGSRRGKIYLSDDMDALYILRKPTFLQPAPKGRYQTWKYKPRKQSMYDGDSGSDTAVEDAEYDCGAYEKV